MNWRSTAMWLMIATIIGLGIYLIVYINSESYACMSNPYTYSIGLLEKSNNVPVSCTCSSQSSKNPFSVILDKDGFHAVKQQSSGKYPEFNYTLPLA